MSFIPRNSKGVPLIDAQSYAIIRVACLRDDVPSLERVKKMIDDPTNQYNLSILNNVANLYQATLIKEYIKSRTSNGYESPLKGLRKQLTEALACDNVTLSNNSDDDNDNDIDQ